MADDPQQALVVEAIMAGRVEGLPDGPVARIDTHAAIVFLIGERAVKMKRAVRYSFLDFTKLADRRRTLEAELRLNRRTAPQLYRRVVPLARSAAGGLELGGDGELVEWLLEMARFDQAALLDRVAAGRGLDDDLIDRLARQIACFHEQAEVRPDHGGYEGIAAVVQGNFEDLRALTPEVLGAPEIDDLERVTAGFLEGARAVLGERRAGGRVRHCHGDLHLRNIVLLEGQPVLFDCLEFDEQLACIDTLYDLAFLLMDLDCSGLRPAAQKLLTGYLEIVPDDAGLALLPLFLSVRAVVRAKVHGFAARQGTKPEQEAGAARRYLEHARAFLAPPPARLVLVGGLSGSGKSSVARALAPDLGPAPGAVVLSSDRLRKQMWGVPLHQRLPAEAYAEEVSAWVYGQIAGRARTLLATGHAVVADAVFADPTHRALVEAAARDQSVPADGLWLDARPEILQERITARRDDPSDATAQVLASQLQVDVSGVPWPRLDAQAPLEQVVEYARSRLDVLPSG